MSEGRGEVNLEAFLCSKRYPVKPRRLAHSRGGSYLAPDDGGKEPCGPYGPPQAFSSAAEIQPILNKHCTRCHDPQMVVQGKEH